MNSTAAPEVDVEAAPAAPGPANLAGFQSVAANQLRVNAKLRVSIYDSRDVLLLAEGSVITTSFLQKLQVRGIASVKVHSSELSRIFAGQPLGTAATAPPSHGGFVAPAENEGSLQLDEQVRRGTHLGLPTQGEAFSQSVADHGATGYDETKFDRFVDKQSAAMTEMETVFKQLQMGKELNVEALGSIADEALADLAEDSDLFACLGVNPFSDRYPVRHSVHTCMLAVSIGTHLGLDRQTLKELSIGCLVHDTGMMKIKQELYSSGEKLDPIRFLEITKHPVFVFDMLKSMSKIPNRSAFIAYQIHERCNGKGYPRRREAKQIHFLSKVAAVADTFIGLVSPRPHRPGMLPYKALETVIRGVGEGLYDASAVRALLNAVSLFPIGSFVLLSDGRKGKVVRANGEQFSRPIVQILEVRTDGGSPEVINLAEVPELQVIKPIATPDADRDFD